MTRLPGLPTERGYYWYVMDEGEEIVQVCGTLEHTNLFVVRFLEESSFDLNDTQFPGRWYGPITLTESA